MSDPWRNLHADRSGTLGFLSDAEIDAWARTDNRPADAWGLELRFDAEGWDLRVDGTRTGWRAYESVPFPGYFPTNGEIGETVVREQNGVIEHIRVRRALDPTSPVRMAPRILEVQYLKRGATLEAAGLIADSDGSLRPQTERELAGCVPCHALAPDGVFSPQRRVRWGRGDGAVAAPDPIGPDGEGVLASWVRAAGGGDDWGANPEARAKFTGDGSALSFEQLKADIRVLTLPSPQRARDLNRVAHTLVDEQSYLRGRELVWGLGL
ncbi:MAG: hypothetical protein R3F61_13075 [Myxococcota bacterium]